MFNTTGNNIMNVISGSLFNAVYINKKFYKFLNNDLQHNGFIYNVGLNVDTISFNPTSKCSSGGLYFCEEADCHIWWNQFGTKMSEIEIPNDATICIEENKFKTNKLIIKSIIDFEDMNDGFWMNIFIMDADALQYIKKQTYEICLKAVNRNGLTLEYVKDQTLKICMEAIKQNNHALCYVKDYELRCVLEIIGGIVNIASISINENSQTLEWLLDGKIYYIKISNSIKIHN